MNARLALFALFALAASSAIADLYMHNPRGSGALVPRFQSSALHDSEISSGKLVKAHRKWSPITFEMQSGSQSIGDASLRYVQKAFKSGKPVNLDFCSVNIDSKGNRNMVYRIHFDGAVIKSLKSTPSNGETTSTITFTFRKTTWTQVKPPTKTQDTWR
jgi:type VI protein secretion system component Hcp